MRRLDLVRRVSIAAISVCTFERAHAQNASAEALFREADTLETAGKLVEACDTFEASNRLEPRAGTLIRLGQCREKTNQLASAWSAYNDAIVRVKDPRKREFATARVAELESRMSRLTVSVPDDRRVDGLVIRRNGKPFDAALWNRAIPVDGGEYVIEGSAPGRAGWTKTATVPVEGGAVTVELFVEEPKAVVAKPVVEPSVRASVAELPIERRGWLTPQRKLALGLAGGGAIALVTGGTFAVLAQRKQRDGRALCPEPQACLEADRANASIDAAQSRALVANIAFVAGAAAVIGGGVLWYLGAPASTERAVAVAPAVAPHEAGVVVFGRF